MKKSFMIFGPGYTTATGFKAKKSVRPVYDQTICMKMDHFGGHGLECLRNRKR